MAITLTAFENEVRRLLGASRADALLTVETGTGGSATLADAQGFLDYYNVAAEELCRTCYPLPMRATGSMTVGQEMVSVGGLTVTSTAIASRLWVADAVQVVQGSATLTLAYTDREQLESWLAYSGGLAFAATGNPARWYLRGPEWAGLYPRPSATATLTMAGLALPPVAVSAGQTMTWATNEAEEALKRRVAAMVGEKNADDADLAPRVPVWMSEYNDIRRRLWGGMDENVRRLHYPEPPALMPVAQDAGRGRR
jgi:hypothetical protein